MSDDLSRPLTGALARFTRDLTADARAGRLEPVRCREEEVSRVIDILLRHGKNNPALVGPSGVGKTAIVEGLAQRLTGGVVPLALRNAQILALDHVSLLAGTTYRGQYEERIRALVQETSADPDVILFVDELHNLIGQGTAIGAAMDAANMLKPALVRGDFRVIGATTGEEYERWVCGDPALERRFQRVLVRELSSAETLDILEARRQRLERHHNVVISDEAVKAAVALTDAHQTDRRRPDRAIDVLDEACAHLQAVARFSPRAEELIAKRREVIRQQRVRETEDAARSRKSGEMDDFARNGMAALERIGAELEAMFAGVPAGAPRSTPATGASPGTPVEFTPAHDLLDAELDRVLTDEGIIVRGADIARVVALSTGHQIQWVEPLPSS
jgi:ATP-dependent Clp protease ATP-binding subunit ClpA